MGSSPFSETFPDGAAVIFAGVGALVGRRRR